MSRTTRKIKDQTEDATQENGLKLNTNALKKIKFQFEMLSDAKPYRSF